ncbi:probable G-protein coupled receptor 139 [Xenopus tropicalis]|uniref:Probable G-protein coupled receptor 139 n=1 Tax=Xenopus tropicalis TaxID=8364 RepID=A0A8J1JMH6_XENTR|nr:probable G-protein coupled receptor 139 [Xenopus tropicalis]
MLEEPWIRTMQRLFYPIMSAFGMPASIITIAILWKGNLEMSKSIIYYLVSLAVANFLLILVVTIFRDIFYFYVDVTLWWPQPSCSVSNWIYFTCVYALIWLTVAFTFDRYAIVCSMKLKLWYCTARTARIVIIAIYVGAFVAAMPTYWMYVPVRTTQPDGSLFHICSLHRNLSSIPFLSAYDHIQTTLWIIIPLVSLVLTNGLTVWHITVTTRVRQGLKSVPSGKESEDPEVARRKKSMTLLLMITISFLGHWLPKMVIKVVERFTYPPVNRYDFYHVVNVVRMLCNMLIVLSSFSNMCIYSLTITRFREELFRGAKYVIRVIFRHPSSSLPPPKQVKIFSI